MTSPPEGPIRIELSANAGKGCVRIENMRPLGISSRFAGRGPAEVAKLVPLVFSVCRAAQSAACADALDEALAVGTDQRVKTVRALLVQSEIAREHALQVLHGWPRCLKVPEPAMASASIKRLLGIDRELARCLGASGGAGAEGTIDNAGLDCAIAELTALLGEAIYGELPPEWLSRRNAGDLSFWARRNETLAQTVMEYLVQAGMADAGATDIAPLPPLEPEALLAILFGANAASFVARPEWDGKPRETTPLARLIGHELIESLKDRYGYGLLARLVACLVELAEVPGRMRSLAASLKEEGQGRQKPARRRDTGTGLGIAEAARGRLIHAVDVAEGAVRRYRILAPTEWNFHPDGAAARGLAGIARSAPAHREVLARLFITAVDPCVAYELRLP